MGSSCGDEFSGAIPVGLSFMEAEWSSITRLIYQVEHQLLNCGVPADIVVCGFGLVSSLWHGKLVVS